MKSIIATLLLILSLSVPSFAAILVSNASGGTPGTQLTLEAARTSAGVAGKTVTITSALTQAQSNILAAWPNDRALEFKKGGSIASSTAFTFADGAVITIPDNLYVFAGSGAVTGLKEARPENFGTGTTAIIKALLAANKVILTPSKTYPMETDFTIDISRNSLVGTNSILDFSAATVSSTYAVKVTSTRTAGIDDPYYQVGNALEGFHVKGVGAAITHGMIFDRAVAPGVSHILSSKLSVYGFTYGLFFKDQAYALQFLNCDVFGNTYGISNSATSSNGGEKISFIGCTIFNNATNVWQAYAGSDFTFSDSSIDYPSVVQFKITAGTIIATNCHIESGAIPLLDQAAATYVSFSNSLIWQTMSTGATPFITVGGTVSIFGGKLATTAGTVTAVTMQNNGTYPGVKFAILGTSVQHAAWATAFTNLNADYFVYDPLSGFTVSSHTITPLSKPVPAGVTFSGNWANFGDPASPLQYWKGPDGAYHLQGSVKLTTGLAMNSNIGVLPVGFRPSKVVYATTTLADGESTPAIGSIRIWSDGTITSTTESTYKVNINCVFY